MSKKHLIIAIRLCNHVYATTKLTEHDMFEIQVVKADLLFHVRKCNVNYFNAWVDKDNDLRIG